MIYRVNIVSLIGGGGQDGSMIKKTRDDAVFVTGIPLDTTFENIRDIFGSIGNIKVSSHN